MKQESECVAVNRNQEVTCLDTGEILPIVNWLDDDGDDCDEEDAVVCIAGPDKGGNWHTIDLQHFENTMMH